MSANQVEMGEGPTFHFYCRECGSQIVEDAENPLVRLENKVNSILAFVEYVEQALEQMAENPMFAMMLGQMTPKK